MAEQSNVTDDLNAIAVAVPHDTYDAQIKADVHVMSEVAKYLLTLNPETLLPNAIRSNQAADTPPDTMPDWTFAQWNGFARDMAQSLREATVHLTTMPGDQQDKQRRGDNFGAFAAAFVLAWNYLIPTLQSLIGADTTSQVAETLAQLHKANDDAQKIVNGMRDASGQVGLSRESTHFKAAAEKYERGARRWLIATGILAAIFLAVAVSALVTFRWEPIAPKNPYESVQFVAGKLLIFAVLSYMVLLCARSYFANRHNAVVNRHRQDALLTYQALVEAAKDTANRDVVLQQAAACIFGPQATGFTKDAVCEAPSAKSIVELLGPIAKQ